MRKLSWIVVVLLMVLGGCSSSGGKGGEATESWDGDSESEAADHEFSDGKGDDDAESVETSSQLDGDSDAEPGSDADSDLDSDAESEVCAIAFVNLPPNAACYKNSQCASGLCYDILCSALCTADTDCASSQYCNSEGYCFPSALGTGGLPVFGVGDGSLGLYAPCATNADCRSGHCAQEMENDNTTYLNFCTRACKSDPNVCDCGHCDAHADRCVPGSAALGAACASNLDCLSFDCDKPLASADSEVYCTQDCSDDSDCNADTVCVTPYADAGYKQCVRTSQTGKVFGASCTQDWECAGGLCYQGGCQVECLTNTDCPTDYACAFFPESARNLCAPANSVGTAAAGEPCTVDYNCQTGYVCLAPTIASSEYYLYSSVNPFTLVANADGGGELGSPLVTYTAAASGTLYLSAMSTEGAGNYLLHIMANGSTQFTSVAEADSSANDLTSGAQQVALNTIVSGSYSGQYDEDWYRFDVTAGDAITITADTGAAVCTPKPACAANETLALPLATMTYTFSASERAWPRCPLRDAGGYERAFDVTLAANQTIRIKAAPHTPGQGVDPIIVVTLPCSYACLAIAENSYRGDSALGDNTFEALSFTAPTAGTYTIYVDSHAGSTAESQFDLTIETNPTAQCQPNDLPVGCCPTNDSLRYCDEAGLLHEISCASGTSCLWVESDYAIYYTCSATGSDASWNGGYPRRCE